MERKVVYEKEFYGEDIESFDPSDILNSDDIVVDSFGDPKGKFKVTVTFEPDLDDFE